MKAVRELIEHWRGWLNVEPRRGQRLVRWLALAGAVVYLLQGLHYMVSLRSILDEGLYLVKGYLFATGVYQPFQDYGVLTNHMPLAFVVPGLVQKWFGAGLLTGRVYALVVGLIGLAGLWAAARRLAGEGWAVAAVWAVALNVALVKNYSEAFSQVLVAALVSWALAAGLGRRLKGWQAAAAGILSGLAVMSRINMAPFAALLVLTILWQHGRRMGAWALGGAALVVAGVHALYWPGILQLWAYWVPEGWLPFLQPYYAPWHKFEPFEFSAWKYWWINIDDPSWNSVIALWDGVRFNFVAVVGVVANLLLWPKRTARKDRFGWQTAVFLNVSFIFLLGMHAWAALTGRSCHFFCFSGYIGFFNAIGLLAVAAMAPFWRRELNWPRALVAGTIFLVLMTGIGFGTFDATGRWLADLSVPLLRGGSVPLWGLFENRFGLDVRWTRRLLPTLAGLSFGLAALAAAWIWLRRQGDRGRRTVRAAFVGVLCLGLVFSPSRLLGGGDETLDCGGNVVAGYEQAAAQIGTVVEAGDRVYYQGANSPIVLLYLPGVQIYPPQLNNTFSFSDLTGAGITEELLRYGYWNEDLRAQWLAEADYALVEARFYDQWQAAVEAGQYDIRLVTDSVEACRGKDAQVLVLERR